MVRKQVKGRWLTLAMMKREACADWQRRFAKTFGKRVFVTEELAYDLSKAGWHVPFLATFVLNRRSNRAVYAAADKVERRSDDGSPLDNRDANVEQSAMKARVYARAFIRANPRK